MRLEAPHPSHAFLWRSVISFLPFSAPVFSDTPSLYPSLNVADRVLHPYKTTGTINLSVPWSVRFAASFRDDDDDDDDDDIDARSTNENFNMLSWH